MGRAPSGVTSEATQRCCENSCHNIHYHDTSRTNCERKTPGSWQTVKQETQTLTKTRERHKGKSAVLLQTVQTESKLPLCVSNSLLGTQRDFHVSALCVEDPRYHHSTAPIDAIEATKPPSTPSKPPSHHRRHRSHRSHHHRRHRRHRSHHHRRHRGHPSHQLLTLSICTLS